MKRITKFNKWLSPIFFMVEMAPKGVPQGGASSSSSPRNISEEIFTRGNYTKLGFKSGLEIHQQLDTRKLFCNCPSLLRTDEPDFVVKRKLHAVAGESGDVDVAVKHEALKNKDFIYQGYDTTCLVEIDEEPPHEINRNSLKVALQIAILLNAKIMPLVQIMRKMVVDGSNTSGFQRTLMIARNGWVETSQGKVGIEAIYLEEDSARPVSRTEQESIYRLDRLGIPLVEIATAPDIKNAEQAKETALKIGEILRSCNVRRGIGTIRQDINISIKNSNRVELKGFQDPKMMIKTIENEVNRQSDLVEKKKSHHRRTPKDFETKSLLEAQPSEVRNVLKDGTSEFQRPMPGAARMYPETDLPLLKIHRNLINEAKKDLPKLRGEIENELKKKGLSEEMIQSLFKQRKVEEFKEMLGVLDNAPLVAKVLLVFPKDVAARSKMDLTRVLEIIEDEIPNILRLVKEKKVSESQIKDIFSELVAGKKLDEAIKVEKVEANDIEEQIAKIIKEKPNLSANAYMGLVMKGFKGKVDGGEVMEIIKKYAA
jgi:glutamyl-tRNA(Gln) amidotransferase subunit E